MSGTDSDLDFESADEDTNYDVHTKNSNTSSKSVRERSNNDCTASHKYEAPETDSCPETKNVDISPNKSVTDVDSNVTETVCDSFNVKSSVERGGNVQERTKSQVETNNIEDNSENGNAVILKNDSEIDVNKTPVEKQRVTLRLEKKIQQKNQVLKDSSVLGTSVISTENTQKQNELKSSSWGFGSWGTSLLSTAASSVSTFTNQVSQGIGTVLETVESTLGAPAPEELAVTVSKGKECPNASAYLETETRNAEEEKNDENNSESRSSILPGVSSWTKVLENTGSRVIMGGLDTLELIGKKTIDMITDNDPGLRKTRSVFGDGVTLSQILREAKAEADESRQDANSEGIEAIHYSQLFDEYQGLVHLEALEMLSTQSQAKLQRLLMRVARTSEVRKNMEEIKSICENIPPLDDSTDCESFEDFDTVCKKYVLELNLPFNVENLIRAQKRSNDVVKTYESATVTTSTPEEIYQSAICSLAEFTAKSIETFHKMTELILIQPTLEPSVEHFATNLTGLTTVMCIEINNLSSRYHRCLDSIAEQSDDNSHNTSVTAIVTNLYVEASNSNKYIQDAFLLLVPVLQALQLESSQ